MTHLASYALENREITNRKLKPHVPNGNHRQIETYSISFNAGHTGLSTLSSPSFIITKVCFLSLTLDGPARAEGFSLIAQRPVSEVLSGSAIQFEECAGYLLTRENFPSGFYRCILRALC